MTTATGSGFLLRPKTEAVMKRTLLLVLASTLIISQAKGQQVDTSSYFPLGFWGIWIDGGTPPLNHQPIQTGQWINEINSWQGINGNYLVSWIPEWIEDTLMSVLEPLGYKMDIHRSNYSFNSSDTSINMWIQQAANPPTTAWKQRALDKLNGLKNRFGTRAGFHTFFTGHESQMYDRNLWPAYKIVVLSPAVSLSQLRRS